MKITRRTFLKFLAGGAAGLLLSPLPWKGLGKISALTQPDSLPLPKGKQEFKYSISGLCPAKTPLKIRLINGQPVQTLPWPEHPLGGQGLSALAAAEVQNLFRPSRLKQPLARNHKGELAPISWQQANELLAHQLVTANQASSTNPAQPFGVACVVGDESDVGSLALRQCLQAWGSLDFYSMPAAGAGQAQSVKAAWQLMGGTGQPGYDLENSDYVLSLGADLLESWGPVLRNRKIFFNALGDSDFTETGAEAESKRSKCKYVYCGPVQNATALACHQWLALKPNMEEFFLIALAGVIIEQMPRTAQEQMGKYADFAAFKNLAKAFPAQKLCPYLGISEAQMQQLARELLLAKRPVVVTASSLGQNSPLQLNLLGLALNMLLDNLNQPGGLTVLPSLEQLLGLKQANNLPADFSGYLHKLQAGEKQLPKVLIISDCNPLYDLPAYISTASANQGAFEPSVAWGDIFKKIPFKIIFSSFMHDTAAECDLVLPTPAGLERWDHVYTPFGCGQVVYSVCPPAFKPPQGAKTIFSILEQLEMPKSRGVIVKTLDSEEKYFDQVCSKLGTSLQELESKGYFCSHLQEAPQMLSLKADLLMELLCDKKNVFEAKTKPVQFTVLPLSRLDLSNSNFGLSVYQGFTSGPAPFTPGNQNNSTALINPSSAKAMGLSQGQNIRICRADMRDVGFYAQVCLSNRIPEGGIGLWAGCGHVSGDQFSAGKGQNIMVLFSITKQTPGGMVFSQASPVVIEK